MTIIVTGIFVTDVSHITDSSIYHDHPIIGAWRLEVVRGEARSGDFIEHYFADGTGRYYWQGEPEEFTWRIVGSAIIYTFEHDSITSGFRISDNELIIYDRYDPDNYWIFRRMD